MEDVATAAPAPPAKKSTTLSVDRAAFLLLRVKKAFKKKRQQRKEKQSQASAAASAFGSSINRGSRGSKIPPPLLRSRTLPAIIVPGIPVVSLHTDKNVFHLEERMTATKSGSNRLSLLARASALPSSTTFNNYNNNNYTNINNNNQYTCPSSSSTSTNLNNNNNYNNYNSKATIKSLNLPKDETTFSYRRKSSGSTPHTQATTTSGGSSGSGLDITQAASSTAMATASTKAAQLAADASLFQLADDFECHPDGSLLLRIPAPHVVAARAYSLAKKKRVVEQQQQQQHQQRTPDKAQPTMAHYAANDGSKQSSNSTTSAAGTGSGSGTLVGCNLSTASASTSNTAFTRLAKLLHQSSTISSSATKQLQSTTQQHTNDGLPGTSANLTAPSFHSVLGAGGGNATGACDETPRRLSWERRKDSSALQRSGSIDSFAEIVWSDSPRPSLDIPRPAIPFSKRPSASSLYSNYSTCSQSTQLNVNYGDVGTGGGAGGGSGSTAGSIGGASGSASSSNSRRESLLSPSATRRNKLTRIINDNILPNSRQTVDSATLNAHCSTYAAANTTTTTTISTATDTDTDNGVILRSKINQHFCNNNYNNNNNNNQHNHNHSNNYNKNNENSYTESLQNTLLQEHQLRRDHCNSIGIVGTASNTNTNTNDNNYNCNNNSSNNNNNTFRWSEQITQNVSVAKIRTAISCNAEDLKEMEFLLPPAAQQFTTTTANFFTQLQTTARSKFGHHQHTQQQQEREHNQQQHKNNLANNLGASIEQAETCPLNASEAAAAVHAHNNNNSMVNMSNAKHAKLQHMPQIVTYADENNSGNAQDVLMLQRLTASNASANAVQLRNGKGGVVGGNGTPHRNSNKMTKKQLKLAQAQLEKLTQANNHLHALFSAVEHGHLDKAKTILESTDVDVNSINTDGLSALDVAVLSNNRSMTKMLLQHGAIDGSQFSTDTVGSKLNSLLKDAESRIYNLSGSEQPISQPTLSSRASISSIIIGNTTSSVTGCTGNEVDKQIGIWERRVKGLRRMLLGWDQARPPDAPASLTVDVTGETSITVQILEPFDGAIGTKFKVQWATRADFNNIVGERELMEWTSFHGTMGTMCHIAGLTQGRRYFIRAACGNVKGWGPYKSSVPASVIPSSWRDLNNLEDRYLGRQRVLDNLFTAVRLARPADVSELTLDSTNVQRRNPKKKTTIKQLFSVASKFQKQLRRGIYLASIVYFEDKVLVTSEEFLPCIEIDESYPSTLHSDYHWLMKVACTWEDVKLLRTDMERNLTSAVHFRTKLLSAVCQMQSALGLTDLGQLYYKPLRDSHGTVVLTCIQSVRNQKSVSILNSRWLPVNKLQKKIVALLEDYNINEMLISSVSDQIHYHQTALQRLSPGLYLGYLKLHCSVEQIQVVVPIKTPNVLPHYKVRDNSHITAEEWQILKRCEQADQSDTNNALRLPLELSTNSEATTEVQRLFLYDLTNAAHKLFAAMNVKPEDAGTHRLYEIEVIEHSKDISFLVVCPSVELSCSIPGQTELLLQRDDLASLSIQAFEMIHLRTYQPGIIQKYARLSCILELDTALANHSQREAFSTSEMQTAKERLAKLQELTASLNAVWKSVRWLMDVIAFARDKNAPPSLAMREILEFAQENEVGVQHNNMTKQQLLQLPVRDSKYNKSGSGRGSWPGPASGTQASGNGNGDGSGGNGSSNAGKQVEHSKSEQNLGLSAVTPSSSSASPMPMQNTPASTPTTATTPNIQTQQVPTQQLLQVTTVDCIDYTNSSAALRKNSGDSNTSQHTTRSFYSTAESSNGSTTNFGSQVTLPPSRSDDTLALAAAEVLKQAQYAASQRKRNTSNITTQTTTSAPLITVHSSNSSPYLSHDRSTGSSLSLKSVYSAEYEYKPIRATGGQQNVELPGGRIKAASSTNLREGGMYLKPTLTALQTQIKSMPQAQTAVKLTTEASTEPNEPTTSKANAASAPKPSETKSLSRQSSEEDTNAAEAAMPTSSSGIIQVYTAYNTGLARGTSLKLHVTPKTTAREVINLVVKQLNMAAVLKGNNGPIYSSDMLDNFCLVAVIGARERCLRDDFKPLQLQNPWKKGRLYVRQKHELLAAIEHSNRKSHLI